MKYHYLIRGTGANDTKWTSTGTIQSDRPGDFPNVIDEAMKESFDKLTQGKAIFGNPGVGGCKGPYKFLHLVVSEENHSDFPKPWDQKSDEEKYDEWRNAVDAYDYLRDWNNHLVEKFEQLAETYTKWDTGAIDDKELHDVVATIGSWWINVNTEPEDKD